MLAATTEARAAFRASPAGVAHFKAMEDLVETLLWAPQISQGSPEWLERRPLLVTGTTARRVEVNPEAELAARLKPPSGFVSAAMAHGTAFEPVARAYISKHLSRRDTSGAPVTIHELGMVELVPGCGASLDGVIGSGDYIGCGLEIKCPQKPYASISIDHATQMQFYMGVTGCPAFLYAALVFKGVPHAEYKRIAQSRTSLAYGCRERLGPMEVPLLFLGDEVDEGCERAKDRAGWWVLEDRFLAWVKKNPAWFPDRLPLYTAFVAKVAAARAAAAEEAKETFLPMALTDPIECPFSPLS